MGRVQTFLPVPDLRASARALDSKRLGKQRIETLQIMRALTVPGYGWQHHPAVRMWRANKAGAPRELVLGYVALMILAAALSSLVLRAL